MHIDYAATLISLKTIPSQDGKTDICKHVIWEVQFFETTYPDTVWSIASIETVLDTDTLSSGFIEFSNLTHQQIVQWALDKQGGDPFLTELLEGHKDYLQHQYDFKDLESKDISTLAEQ